MRLACCDLGPQRRSFPGQRRSRVGRHGRQVALAVRPGQPLRDEPQLDRVVLAPHVGSATVETRIKMGDLVCDNLDGWLSEGRVVAAVPECADLNG